MPLKGHASGNYDRTIDALKKGINPEKDLDLDKYGQMGVANLQARTPANSGKTAQSWYYDITKKGSTVSINFRNSYTVNGTVIAILIDKGHATRGGGFVPAKPFIDEAIDPVYDEIIKDIRKGGS